MWASDSEEDEPRAGFGASSSKKGDSVPIGFVRGGVQQAGQPKTDAAGASGSSSLGPLIEEDEEFVYFQLI